ncbi:MAG: type I DNA topoisomerase [Candidatus Dependentiae bacterium]|nr:type I DNA topoisomerase [Candidatus Dependentiae bacterium]
MKKLLIVESPAKIKTISKFLGKNYKIMSTLGHVKDLPQRELGITMNDSIEIAYVVLDKKDKVLADICKEAQKAEAIYLAPDPDREGEIIAWHVAQEIEKVVKDSSVIHRIAFNEITQPAIEYALEHPSTIDLDKVSAQQARRILDRWVGYEVSPILWKKITKGLSAGRVQSVALKLICDRETEIRNFKPEEYWSIDGLFGYNTSSFTAALTHINDKKIDIKDKAKAESIQGQLKKETYIVESVKDSKRLKNAAPPFMTSTLQQAAFNQLGFSVQKTMQVAQQLYEGIPLSDPQTPVALITYMRTDSLRISETALKQARSYIKDNFGNDYLPGKSLVYSKSKAQDAHEAIRPIDVTLTPEKVTQYLEPAAAKLYTLIWKRFVASQMKPAEYAQRQVVIVGGPFTFKVTGSTLMFDGFLKVYQASDDEEESHQKIAIPKDIAPKKEVTLKKIEPKQHFTQPPARYTEASLVKELEREGIGRPSTYATIMKTIQARAYTTLDSKKRFSPTELGMAVTNMLHEYLPDIMNVKFTAQMEEKLDEIAQGALDRDKLLRSFYKAFEKDVTNFRGETAKKQPEPTDLDCPQCKKNKLAIRFGKTGPFLGCLGFPECTFTSNFERKEDGTIVLVETKTPQLLDETCPKCGKQLRQIVGRFGPFIACSGYPDCTYIKQTIASFKCPQDGGDVIKRTWKGKVFWGCSNYPKCTFSISGDIEDKPCPKCKKPYLLKKVDKSGTVTLVCDNKECGYKKEIAE